MKLVAARQASDGLVLVSKTIVSLLLIAIAAYAQSSVATNPLPQPGALEHTLTAPRLTVVDKFDYRVYRGFILRGGIGSLFAAGLLQATKRPKEWGYGGEAYARRYASSLGVAATRQAVTSTLEVISRQDPRYFPSTETGLKPRFRNAMRQVFTAKNDEGLATFAYSKIVGGFAAGQISNAWLPKSINGTGKGFERGGLILAGDAGVNLLAEFVPFFRDHVFKRNQP